MKYYQTPRDSETGKKISEIEERLKKGRDEFLKLKRKYGFVGAVHCWSVVIGEIKSILFKDGYCPDKRIWKRVKSESHNNLWWPKSRSIEGREIIEKLNSIQTISKLEVNMSIGYNEPLFQMAAISFGNKNLFGIKKNFKHRMPYDCKEIDAKEYAKLFGLVATMKL